MKLHDLAAGQEVVLEIIWGEALYSITTKILGVKDEEVLLQPIVYRGEKLELESDDDHVAFNLYHVEEKTGKRVGWKNVSLAVRKYKNEVYYVVKTGILGSLALSSERRANIRTVLDIAGTVECKESSWEVKIGDISDVGISFFLPKNVVLPLNDVTVCFEDVVKGYSFNLRVRCKVIRNVKLDNGLVKYGCSVFKPPFDVMMYTYMKRLEKRHYIPKPAEENKEKGEEEAKAPNSPQAAEETKKAEAKAEEKAENKAENKAAAAQADKAQAEEEKKEEKK